MGRTTPPDKGAVHDAVKEGDGKAYGLVLDARADADGNPTVPATPHTVVGLPGYYTWQTPTPIGGPGEATLEQAVAASKDEGCGVTLVVIASKDLSAARAEQKSHIDAGRNVVAELAPDLVEMDEGEVERVTDEAGAVGVEV